MSTVELSGTVERVVFKSPENGFCVFSLKVRADDVITMRGYVGDLHQGTSVTVKGTWTFHPKFGRQFNADECFSKPPTSAEGIEKYLSSGMIKGIGPKFAERLVKKFGEKTLEVIDADPNRLYEVSGVGPKRIASIIEAWQDQKEISRVMVYLRSKDVSPAFATKIYKTYGNESIDKVQENPYRLVTDIWGVGFKTADQIALKIGLEKNSLERISAGILYTITKATEFGHLYIKLEELKENVIKILEIDAPDIHQRVKTSLKDLFNEDKVKLISLDDDKHFLTLPKFYHSEKGIARRLEKLLSKPIVFTHVDMDKVYKQVSTADEHGVSLNEDQQRGIMSCLHEKVTIITGGPGTGKTTLVKRLIHVLDDNRIQFKLAAPTGRAAKRMFESTGKSTETLHRLLEFAPGNFGFGRNEQNTLELDFLIIDEASMIDVFLMHSVLKALPPRASLVLLGDVDQLPSVGAGNVLNDLIDSKKIPVTRLKQIFRQAGNSMIIVNAHRVNNGEFPQSTLPGSKKDFSFIKENTPENMFPLLRQLYTVKFPKLGIHPDDAIVLVPMNRGIVGTQRLNEELQNILNPENDPVKQIMQFGRLYKTNDRVMQIRNNYEKFVFNGDIGKITEINKVDQKMKVRFDNRDLEYDFAELNELTLSYAISIHKSQGSEFKAVIIPIFMQHFILLQRNLIYTAITRAKSLCILVGQTKAVAMGIKNNKGVDRQTFLKEYLTTDLEAR